MKKKKTNNQFVKDISHLKELISHKHNDFALLLAGGICHSKKTIYYDEKKKKFRIINHIDDSIQTLSEKQLMDPDYTLIGKAMPLNSLIAIIE